MLWLGLGLAIWLSSEQCLGLGLALGFGQCSQQDQGYSCVRLGISQGLGLLPGLHSGI
jgi:hypothetical protein